LCIDRGNFGETEGINVSRTAEKRTGHWRQCPGGQPTPLDLERKGPVWNQRAENRILGSFLWNQRLVGHPSHVTEAPIPPAKAPTRHPSSSMRKVIKTRRLRYPTHKRPDPCSERKDDDFNQERIEPGVGDPSPSLWNNRGSQLGTPFGTNSPRASIRLQSSYLFH
jgi:hypothetical protein